MDLKHFIIRALECFFAVWFIWIVGAIVFAELQFQKTKRNLKRIYPEFKPLDPKCAHKFYIRSDGSAVCEKCDGQNLLVKKGT